MKRSKSQAVYKFLPGIWISEKNESNIAVTAKITHWNYIRMENIFDDFIENEIKRQIGLFANRQGDVTSFDLSNEINSFYIVEPACREGIPDIIGEMSPLVFYCSSCGHVIEKRYSSQVDNSIWKCTNPECKSSSVKQLQMIYACECGYAQGVRIPYVKGVSKFSYKPSENKFKMTYKVANSEKNVDIAMPCPTCNTRLLPKNANDGKNYRPFTLCIINLVDPRSGEFYKKGIEAKKAIVTKWFDYMSQAQFEDLLSDISEVFSESLRTSTKRREIREKFMQFVTGGVINEAQAEMMIASELNNLEMNDKSIEKYVLKCDELHSDMLNLSYLSYEEWLNYYSFKIMQFDTIKFAKRVISLEDSIECQKNLGFIDSSEEIFKLHDKMGIKNMQVSCDVQIVNCTYGYSRIAIDPVNNNNKNCRLKLNSFGKIKDGHANLVYGAKLDTEGMLFEISQKKIIEWLEINHIINEYEMPDLEDELSIKKWFAEKVHGDQISMFGEIDSSEIITKYVFGLLHSISHAFIKMAGELSGLSSNSLTEIVFVETASIFIYAQTSQGNPLGALSGMAEMRYQYFLKRTLEDSKDCIFDPICKERDDSSCSGCLILPEISCNHFNSGLGRKYLYSLSESYQPKIGFWEMM